MDEYKLIVAGGRDFNDYDLLSRVLFAMADVELADKAISIVCGMARGADRLGLHFAGQHDVKLYQFPADWEGYGKYAGYYRNKQMGNFSDALLAFWDGKSRGTKQMIEYMQGLGKPVHIVNY